MGKSVLITRDPREKSLLGDFCKEFDLTLLEKSFIETVSVTGLDIPPCHWVFFSSPRGGRAFLETYKNQLSGNEKFAALGPATAGELEKDGINFDFIGDADDTTGSIGADFKKILGSDKVLFPISQISQKKVSSEIPTEQCIELQTYTTTPVDQLVAGTDLIIFTSPSNLEGYLMSNTFPVTAHLFCYGETTEKALEELRSSNKIHSTNSTNQVKLITMLSKFI